MMVIIVVEASVAAAKVVLLDYNGQSFQECNSLRYVHKALPLLLKIKEMKLRQKTLCR